MNTYTFTREDLTNVAAVVVESAINQLVEFGEISQERGDEINTHYAMVVVGKGFFAKTIDKLFFRSKEDGPNLYYRLVKIFPTNEKKK